MKINWIEPDILAASSVPIDAKDVRSLHEQGIRAIISVRERPITTFKEITPQLLAMLDIVYLHVPVPDHHPPDIPQADLLLLFIDRMRSTTRPTLVHCNAGIGRTGTVLHLYYLAQGLSIEEAKARVRARRPQCILLSDEQIAFQRNFARPAKSSRQHDSYRLP